MSLAEVIVGMVLMGRGGYVLARRKENPGQPKRVYGLEPLQDVLGDGVGSAIHWTVFVVVPLALGGYAFLSGLGFDRSWGSATTDEATATRESTPEQDAEFQLVMAQARLSDAGFAVSMLEQGKGLRVSEDRFAGAIVQSGTGWRVLCAEDLSFPVATLAEAEAKILECHHRPR